MDYERPDNLSLLIKDYLLKQTNYAVMLAAEWGAGKTYYLKKNLLPDIQDLGYQGIVVSLFGVTSIDDVKQKIFLELYPLFANTKFKCGTQLIKALIKSVDFTKLFGDGILSGAVDNFSEAANEISKSKFEFLNLKKLLICFDDLERVDPQMLTDNQIIGFINSLVEDENIKVIVVANENKIKNEAFFKIKEKTIGNTIHFQQNFDQVLTTMLSDLQSPSDKYVDFILSNKVSIYSNLLKENEKYINYRTLSYFLTYFNPIYQCVFSEQDNAGIQKNRFQISSSLLLFGLMVCTELKKGNISYKDRPNFEKTVDFTLRKLYKLKNDGINNPVEQIIDLYYKEREYEFYGGVFDYLTGGKLFDKSQLIKDICLNYHIDNGNILPQYEILDSLSPFKYWELSDKEYRQRLSELRRMAILGLFSITEYITVFYYLMRNGNLLRLKPEKLVRQFIIVIRSKKADHKYHPLIHEHFRNSADSEFHNYYSQMEKAIVEVNNQVRLKEAKVRNSKIEYDLEFDFDNFFDKVVKDIRNFEFASSISELNPTRFFSIFKKAENLKKHKIVMLLRIIYNSDYGYPSPAELPFIESLERILAKYVATYYSAKVSYQLYKEFLEEIKKRRTRMLES